jgi:hypothetical protein
MTSTEDEPYLGHTVWVYEPKGCNFFYSSLRATYHLEATMLKKIGMTLAMVVAGTTLMTPARGSALDVSWGTSKEPADKGGGFGEGGSGGLASDDDDSVTGRDCSQKCRQERDKRSCFDKCM